LLVLLINRVVDSHDKFPILAQLRAGVQIDERITGQYSRVGSIIKALAQSLNVCSKLPISQAAINSEHENTTGAQTAVLAMPVKPGLRF